MGLAAEAKAALTMGSLGGWSDDSDDGDGRGDLGGYGGDRSSRLERSSGQSELEVNSCGSHPHTPQRPPYASGESDI